MTLIAPQPRTSESAARAPAAPVQDAARRMEELGRIIMAYSEVTDRLQRSHHQLTQTVESLRQELGEKNKLLERKNRLAALGEMAAGLAHEIRNPLGGIQLYASMLTKDMADRPDALAVVGKISACVRRLDELVSQVLHFTREIMVSPQPADLADVVAQAVELASKTMLDRNVRCEVSGPQTLSVNIDPLLMGHAILNLLLNAAEAIECTGTVFVEFSPPVRRGKQLELVVRDTGPGIAPDVLDRIFNPFFTTKDTGTGLGLAIVHRVIEAHDGTISACNQEEGGARFEVCI